MEDRTPALTIESFGHRLSSYLEPSQIAQVKRAYYYAEQAHLGQFRRSGEAYINHPLEVANILASIRMDHQSLMAAMLHDVIEDTGIAKKAIVKQFGETVADIVDGVSKLAKIEYATQAEKQAENFQKMALAMAKDLRVIVVKLSDRLHNMRTLGVMPPEKKRRIAKETLEIYSPIAQRLGMNDWRVEFEDQCFKAMHPLRSNRLHASLQVVRGNRKSIVEKIQMALEQRLQRDNISSLVIGREKHLYSIYKKMRDKQKSFKEIMDVYAFRIIVEDIDTCYRALGSVHNLYKPVHGEFKDYIAIPKVNGYQSLHTVVIGRQGVPIEVQIRTKEMDELASTGIAAHWLYKSQEQHDASAIASVDRANRWIKRIMEIKQHTHDSVEFVENVKIDLFRDEVYVFTPKGDIIELPTGATVVDFAYAVHTDVGNHCVACRINDRPAPLSQRLESGQKIKIITTENSQPNPNWLNFINTAKARSAIRHYLKNQRHIESVELGKRMLKRALIQVEKDLDKLSKRQTNKLLKSLNFESLEDLYEAIGLGKIAAVNAAKSFDPKIDVDDGKSAPIAVESNDSVLISFARCCWPIPGDPIVGHLSADRGIIVHRDNCSNVAGLRKNENVTSTFWSPDIRGEFLVDIRVEVERDRGIIASLATRVSSTGTSIERIQVDERDAEHSVITLTIGVENRVHLANVMRSVRTMRSVEKIYRVTNQARARN
jgi:guanosine-3',5'-bis(diphosphate) 3'-pyrophosphohydrolase